ncbi:hypothetical protein EVAR_82578_1 [Eumeta japonica]|uniref:Uncharacterized protein n=1 Tax=Eumeta variegata TaxID=151549 RepID=A0A4C1UXU7_EUMVA|nr:hypothetical protein EVAR_82578_1 [Eumeta japonica]
MQVWAVPVDLLVRNPYWQVLKFLVSPVAKRKKIRSNILSRESKIRGRVGQKPDYFPQLAPYKRSHVTPRRNHRRHQPLQHIVSRVPTSRLE